jgi:HD-GYP domain-containing protein (c-di-GMP phosphodiesterase class II)
MEQPTLRRQDDRRTGMMVARCQKLSLPCVRPEESTVAVLSDVGALPARFMGSPAFANLLKGALERRQGEEPGEGIKLFEGCWLLPLELCADPASAAAVLLTESALQTSAFGVVCASAGVKPADMRSALQPWVQRGVHGPERLATVLRWTREDLEAADRQDGLLREFSDKLIQSYEETHVLFRIMRFMASSGSPREQVQLVCNQILQILPFRWVGVVFCNHERVESTLRGQLVLAGDTPFAEPGFRQGLGALLDAHGGDNWTRVLYPGESELADVVGAEVACDPITYNGSVVGALVAGTKTGPDTAIASPEIQFIDAVADFLGTFHENAVRFAEQQALFIGTLRALSAAIDAKDPYTRGHSDRVAYLSGALALALGQGDEAAARVRVAGLVHDIGKIGVPEAILCKAGRLTDEEFEAIKRHPEIGHHILRDIDPLQDVLPGVLHHHERWDGRGYPHRLAGEKIPMIARIIGLADTFDAMSSTRSYRPAMPRESVLREIERGSGSQFDPRIVDAFRSVDLTGYDEMLAQRPAGGESPRLGMAA